MHQTLPHLLLAAEAETLVDPLKPILLAVIFIPWGWIISSVIEPDARYYNLPYHRWNGICLAGGALAILAALFIPIFWVGWPVAIILLAAPILAYWKIRNAAVPAEKRFYLTGEGFTKRLAARKAATASRDAKVTFIDPAKKPLPVPTREEPLFEIHLLAEQMLEPAVAARANRLELAPAGAAGGGGYLVSQIVDGVRYKREVVPADRANAVIDYLKGAAKLDVNDKRRRQTGQFRMHSGLGDTMLDLAVAGGAAGQTMRVDFDRSKRVQKAFDSLGLLPSQQEVLAALAVPANRHGVILVGAPPGHGLTTTLYALIGRHDAFTSNIKTLERQIELRLDGVDHTQFDASNTASDYPTNLQSILRRDPDIVLIADLKDPSTGKVAASPGISGPLMYVPQALDSPAAQWAEWSKAVGDLKKAASPLVAIMNQRLLRVVCPQCRQPFQPSPEQAKKLGLPANKQHTLFKAGGKVQVKNRIEDCPICNGVGYFGQIAAFEVMPVDEEARKLLAANDFRGAYAVARRNRMLYLQEAALAKVREGQTTIEELARVLNAAKAEPAPAAATA
ncbi:MAG: ATPase, T2SS/T4P/T4SS family [Phycisphaerales bacterium]